MFYLGDSKRNFQFLSDNAMIVIMDDKGDLVLHSDFLEGDPAVLKPEPLTLRHPTKTSK
jgi:hypothetical protein